MKTLATNDSDMLFSVGAVEEELERIYHDPHFTESAILRKFLSFIVLETIQGRSNCLKEYTIAINVLDKPLNFNPQENCIVRIHAGRLRRALDHYYTEMGRADQIVITIPKGKYVPMFAKRVNAIETARLNPDFLPSAMLSGELPETAVAVIPFMCITKQVSSMAFRDGLCLRMSSLLSQLSNLSTIAYQPLKMLAESNADLRDLASRIGFHYAITGGIQFARDKVQVNLQLIDCASYKQVWSATIEKQLTKSNFFDVQDEICLYAMKRLEDVGENRTKKSPLVVNGEA